jgi:putative dehydrogenase
MYTRHVGVIGLGAMGFGVARSLLRVGFDTRAFDVRPEALQQFESEGGVACADPAELGAACEVIVTVVVNADQTDSVLFGDKGAATTLRRGSVVIASATVLPEYAERLGHRLAEQDILLIDAPLGSG